MSGGEVVDKLPAVSIPSALATVRRLLSALDSGSEVAWRGDNLAALRVVIRAAEAHAAHGGER